MDVTIWVVDVIDVSLVLVMNKSQQGRARIYVNAQFVFSTQRNAAPPVDSDGRSCVVRHAQHNPVRSDKTDKWMYDCVGVCVCVCVFWEPDTTEPKHDCTNDSKT